MTTGKQKLTLIVSILLAFALGMGAGFGCSFFTEERVAGTAGKVLEIAYAAGGAAMVEQKIDQLVADGKITAEQASLLKAAAQKSYEELQRTLRDKGLSDVEVSVTK